MERPTLAIDVSYLAHRAFHTTGGLSHEGDSTGVLFGVFRDIMDMRELFNADRIAFCFDAGYDGRLSIYPWYKERRTGHGDRTPDEQEARRDLRRQIYQLRTKLLSEAGFRNVFWQEGYEADDVIASVCNGHTCDFVIVSSDHDLFQCLQKDRVTIWNPATKKAFTWEAFVERYGIEPSLWAHAKAIAGCDGDDVPGVKGVGEVTAARYLSGQLKPTSKAWQSIVRNKELIDRNIKLVSLPFPGCGPFDLSEDDVTTRSWDAVMRSLGMSSLLGRR